MGFQIKTCKGDAPEIESLARFLAQFVADGETEHGSLEESRPEVWRNRLNWWWVDNPFQTPDLPRGYYLESEAGEIVGFFGYFAHDYELDGEVIPSLISTTTFVRRSAREGALGLIMKAHRIKEQFQLVDGGPNEAMEEVVIKLGYQKADPGLLYFTPIRKASKHPVQLLMNGLGRCVSKGNWDAEGKLLRKPIEIGSIPEVRDGLIRKRITVDSLRWYNQSGSSPKTFLGWADGNGVLQCYFSGNLRKKRGVSVFQILDYAAFTEAGRHHLPDLVMHAAHHPEVCGLSPQASVIVWASAESQGLRCPRIRYDSKLYYRLPAARKDAGRRCIPYEGDKPFL